jgi:hypothetical protein
MNRAIIGAVLALTTVHGGCSHPVLTPEVEQVGRVLSQSTSSFASVAGRRWTYSVSSDELASEPDWAGPSFGLPPLSLEDAVTIARHEIPKYIETSEDLKVVRIEIESLCCPERWFYVISFRTPQLGDDSLSIPVLMSGRAVELQPDSGA